MLHKINRDLQIVNSEEINLTESTDGHPVAEQCVKDIKTYISMQMQDMKNYFEKKLISKLSKQKK